MKLELLVVGRTTDKRIVSLIDEYVDRVKHYITLEIKVIPELKSTKSLSEEQQKEQEGALILQSIQSGDYVVLLDEHGKELRSVELATWMQGRMNSGLRRVVFVVGGPYGFAPAVYQRADDKLSLSRLTFSHQMIRLVFAEQVYRAMTILRGEPYHHE